MTEITDPPNVPDPTTGPDRVSAPADYDAQTTQFRIDQRAFALSQPPLATWMKNIATMVKNWAAEALASRTAAATSAENAATSESNAASSASNAAGSASAVLSVNLGSHASDAEAETAAGGSATNGQKYFNTASQQERIKANGTWGVSAVDANGALLAANDLSDVSSAAAARANLLAADRRWQAKTGAYTAISGDRILADTSGGVFTVTLPAGPTAGDEVWFADPGSNWATNNLTVSGNGNNIDGASTFTANVNEGAFIAIYNGTAWVVRLATGAA